MKKEAIIIYDWADFKEELRNIIRETIKEELCGYQFKPKGKKGDNVYLTIKELSEYLSISRSSIYRYIRNDVFTCYKMGKRALFNMKEVEEALIKAST